LPVIPATSKCLPPRDAIAVLLVLRKHLEDVIVGEKSVRDTNGEGPGVQLGIVKGHLHVEMPEVTTPEAFDNAQLVAVNVAQCVEKKLPVYAQEAPQEQALKINGLRAVFGEKYPPMVRVV